MIPLVALMIGAAAAALTSLIMAIGPGALRHRTIRGVATFAALTPFLWVWARHADQFPATFGGFLIFQLALQKTQVLDRLLRGHRHNDL